MRRSGYTRRPYASDGCPWAGCAQIWPLFSMHLPRSFARRLQPQLACLPGPMQFLVKYIVDGTTKTVQGDRNNLSFNAIKSAIARGAGKGNFKCASRPPAPAPGLR